MKKLRFIILSLLFACGFAGVAWGTVEAVTYISDLNVTLPASGDARSEGDDHLRNLKIALKNTFPNITGAVTPTHTELNFVDGVTSAIQTQLDAKAASTDTGLHFIASTTASGTATVDFTSSIDGTYEEYELHIINAIPATNLAFAQLRTSANAGVAWDASAGNYDYVVSQSGASAVAVGSVAGGAQVRLETSGVSSTASNGGFNAVVRIADPAATASNKRITWTFGVHDGSNIYSGTGTANRNSTSAVNGLRFLFSTGNITSGKFKLYGVRKS